MQTFLGSKGYVAQAADNGTYVTVLTVPTGFHVKITYFLAAATATTTVDAKWVNGTDIPFLHSKNMSAGELVEFGGPQGAFLVLTDGDTIQVKSSNSNLSVIMSYELYPHQGSNIVL